MGNEVNRLTATELDSGLRGGQITVAQIARACLERIASRDAEVRAWSYVDPDAVIRQARELDKLPSRSDLHAIPFGIKDIYNTADMPTQHNSPIYTGHRPTLRARIEAEQGTRRPLDRCVRDPARYRLLYSPLDSNI
jgi:Asp-tRNA(Asn)/Glu-tRNA(Gln) amidotransferase A subunit family amidase